MFSREEKLTISSQVFADLRDQINVQISGLLQEANVSGKEGEITLKIKVTTATERNHKNGMLVKEWTEPRFSWIVGRKVKEEKIDIKSSAGEGFILTFDDEGKPVVKEVPVKQSLFDQAFESMENIHKLNKQAAALGLVVSDEDVEKILANDLQEMGANLEDEMTNFNNNDEEIEEDK